MGVTGRQRKAATGRAGRAAQPQPPEGRAQLPDDDNEGSGLNPATVQLVLKETKDFVRSLEGTGIRRVKVKAGDLEIEVERRQPVAGGAIATAGTAAVTDGAASGVATGMMPVLAPLVGVFYRSGSPGAKPFVEVGDIVERGQQIAIVEAMKMMNEVTSDYRGRVAEILVENAQPVQFEQRLMLIDVSGSS
jgi:acetyl-CoA carboxylase biotin carboxyl carrier protein